MREISLQILLVVFVAILAVVTSLAAKESIEDKLAEELEDDATLVNDEWISTFSLASVNEISEKLGVQPHVGWGVTQIAVRESAELLQLPNPDDETCDRNYNVMCPIGWIDLGDGANCKSPPGYLGSCPGVEDMSSYSPIDKHAFANACGVSWPCFQHCDREYKAKCPAGWALTDRGYCEVPEWYDGPCAVRRGGPSFWDMTQWRPTHKQEWAAVCKAQWPCKVTCMKDYTSNVCPKFWETDDFGFCVAPVEYAGSCELKHDMREWGVDVKKSFEKMCLAQWACKPKLNYDFNELCPLGWTYYDSPVNSCIPPPSYRSSKRECRLGFDPLNATPGMKAAFGEKCLAYWPPLDSCPRDYTSPCPDGWSSELNDSTTSSKSFFCIAPINYIGKCALRMSFTGWLDAQKEAVQFECDFRWPCSSSYQANAWNLLLEEQARNKRSEVTSNEFVKTNGPVSPEDGLLKNGDPRRIGNIAAKLTQKQRDKINREMVKKSLTCTDKCPDEVKDLTPIEKFHALKRLEQEIAIASAAGESEAAQTAINSQTARAINLINDGAADLNDINEIADGFPQENHEADFNIPPEFDDAEGQEEYYSSFLQLKSTRSQSMQSTYSLMDYLLAGGNVKNTEILRSREQLNTDIYKIVNDYRDIDKNVAQKDLYARAQLDMYDARDTGVLCQRDYNFPCPLDWSVVGEICSASNSYLGSCDKIQIFTGMSHAQKEAWAEHCGANWPCMKCMHDYVSYPCPQGWKYVTETGLCIDRKQGLPEGPYGRICPFFMDFRTMSPSMRRRWAVLCQHDWPCRFYPLEEEAEYNQIEMLSNSSSNSQCERDFSSECPAGWKRVWELGKRESSVPPPLKAVEENQLDKASSALSFKKAELTKELAKIAKETGVDFDSSAITRLSAYLLGEGTNGLNQEYTLTELIGLGGENAPLRDVIRVLELAQLGSPSARSPAIEENLKTILYLLKSHDRSIGGGDGVLRDETEAHEIYCEPENPYAYKGTCSYPLKLPHSITGMRLMSSLCGFKMPCLKSCEKDFDSLTSVCPIGWLFNSFTTHCIAPADYKGICPREQIIIGMSKLEKLQWAAICNADWPCKNAMCAMNFESQLCPLGWTEITASGVCTPPFMYKGPCADTSVFMRKYTNAMKEEFAYNCAVRWPCKDLNEMFTLGSLENKKYTTDELYDLAFENGADVPESYKLQKQNAQRDTLASPEDILKNAINQGTTQSADISKSANKSAESATQGATATLDLITGDTTNIKNKAVLTAQEGGATAVASTKEGASGIASSLKTLMGSSSSTSEKVEVKVGEEQLPDRTILRYSKTPREHRAMP